MQWDIVSPFVGFRYSEDYGKTWIKCPHDGFKPLFPEKNTDSERVKFGAPHVVDFGKGMEHSPDGYAYMVGHGSSANDTKPRIANAGWVSGDQIYLCRMKPSPQTINDIKQYEFFAGKDKKGNSLWAKDISQSKPLVEWNNNMGCVTITYNPYIKKYIMCITDGIDGMGVMNTYFLESDQITGNWKIISYWKNFGPQAYFVNLPSKFMYKNGKMWLCFSGNYWSDPLKYIAEPYGSDYGMCLFELELIMDKK